MMLSRGALRMNNSRRCFSSYGFVGIGRMGAGMARNLRAKIEPGASLQVYDLHRDACQALAKEVNGIEVVNEIKDLSSAECVITMLPNSEHVEACFADGLVRDNAKDRLFIDCSTIDPFRSSALAKKLADAGHGRFIDAPVSGGVKGASAGTLSFMVGQASKDIDSRVESVLAKMGAVIHYCGEAGAGLSAKLVNNYLLALNNIATAEAMNLGLKLGLQPSVLGAVINSSTGKCWPSEKNNPVAGIVPGAPAENDFAGGFGIELMLKDLGLALAAADGAGVHLGAKDYALSIYKEAAKQYPNKDFGVVFKHYQAMSK